MKKLMLAGLALVSATALYAQADWFGRKPMSMPTEPVTTSAVPKLLQGERKLSLESESNASASQLESREPSAPTFLRGTGAGRKSGFTFMQATGYGFGALFGITAAPRLGYIFENGFYLGASYQISFGSTFFNPLSPTFDASTSAIAQSATVEIGHETSFKLLGLTFYNRPYLGLGLLNVPFLEENVRAFNPQNRNTAAMPPSGINVFGTVGNVLYYRFEDLKLVRGLTLGLDARYMVLNQASAFGLFFTTGIRLF